MTPNDLDAAVGRLRVARLHGYESKEGVYERLVVARSADLRLVLDALKEAERIRHKMDPALSAKVGHPTCGKCGVVIPEPETCCRGTHGKIETREAAKEQS